MISRLASTACRRHQQSALRVSRSRCRFSSSSTPSSGAPPQVTPPVAPPSKLGQWWDRGTILIGFGWALFGVLLVDRYLQYSESMNVQQAVGIVEDESRQKRKEITALHLQDKTLFKCKVRKSYDMGGSHALLHVAVDDVVEVLQEGVGPDALYNLCRSKRRSGSGPEDDNQEEEVLSIGWYPIQYLEKVKTTSTLSKLAFWKK